MGRKKWKPASLLVLREHFLPSAMEMIFGLELLLFANLFSPWLFSFGECVSPRAERQAPAVCQRWVMAADGIYVGKPFTIKRLRLCGRMQTLTRWLWPSQTRASSGLGASAQRVSSALTPSPDTVTVTSSSARLAASSSMCAHGATPLQRSRGCPRPGRPALGKPLLLLHMRRQSPRERPG